MEKIYIGVDFHARQQTICYLTTDSGELLFQQLKHQDKDAVRAFYTQFTGQVIVGLEASGYSPWFERLLEELAAKSGWAMPPRSGDALAAATKTIGGTRS